MIIRQANPEDAKAIAFHLLLAMEDFVYKFIGENSYNKANELLIKLAGKKNNQYSYENCWVVETDDGVYAVALVYDGAKLLELRALVASEIESMFGSYSCPEDETQAGEYYIDCVAVNPTQQGKGIGTKLFKFLIKHYVEYERKTLGLLVDKDNPDAKKLYLKLGFEVVGEKTLTGKPMEHLCYHPQKAETNF
jgi:ribosomal protein S18 acetylase RimI-like enzyme